MDVAVIINPISGARGRPGAGRARRELAEAVLAASGVRGMVSVTERAGHGRELARTALVAGARLVVAWGGDGTMNEVASALAFGPTPLGIVRAGSGNGLATALGVPADPAAALRGALTGAERTIDAGELDGRFFFNVAGIGLDAAVAAGFARGSLGRRGVLPYLALAAREFVRYRPRDYVCRVDGDVLRVHALLVVCANGTQYGRGAAIAPDARLDDGALDVVIVGARSSLALAVQARRLFNGTIGRLPGVSIRRFERLEVQADGPLLFHVDGEPVQGGPVLQARVHPGALRLRLPPARPDACRP
jgi:diacylglycerol kinase (ATP)